MWSLPHNDGLREDQAFVFLWKGALDFVDALKDGVFTGATAPTSSRGTCRKTAVAICDVVCDAVFKSTV